MRTAPPEFLQARLRAVAESLAAARLDALLVTSLPNIAYLTGFFASAGAAVVSADGIILIGDSRYAEALAARAQAHDHLTARVLAPGASYDSTIVDVLTTFSGGRIGFEASQLTVSRYNFVRDRLAAAPSVGLVETADLVERARAIKDEWEVATLRDAAARLADVAKCILPKALAGRKEAEVAAEIDAALRYAGFERPAFDTIVASGPNAARPHARAGQRRIEADDLVVMDFGGVLDGYCTDVTRTVTAGRGSERARRVIDLVTEAQSAAFAAVKPGGRPESVDAAAREVLTRHAMGDAFMHGTGHGLGLEVHEAPRLSPARPSVAEPPLATGMVMTLEPGAYFPGWGGVRIEDDVLVTRDGADWLTK